MRKETQNTHNEMHYCFIEYLEILRGIFVKYLFGQESDSLCMFRCHSMYPISCKHCAPGFPKLTIHILSILSHLSSFPCFHSMNSKAVYIIHDSERYAAMDAYSFVEFVEVISILSCQLLHLSKRQRVTVCADEAVFCPSSFLSYSLHAKKW
jgi:hypothetical protein